MLDNIKALTTASQDARERFCDLTKLKREVRENVMRQAQRIIDAELKRIYDPILTYAYRDQHDAEKALYEARETAGRAGVGAPAPLGTVYLEWGKKVARWDRATTDATPFTLTGNSAVLESITAQSKHPENVNDCRHAQIGSFVLRLRKRDGSLGIKYLRISKTSVPRGWHPEGFDPNTVTKE